MRLQRHQEQLSEDERDQVRPEYSDNQIMEESSFVVDESEMDRSALMKNSKLATSYISQNRPFMNSEMVPSQQILQQNMQSHDTVASGKRSISNLLNP
jgi:hypothetical protein